MFWKTTLLGGPDLGHLESRAVLSQWCPVAKLGKVQCFIDGLMFFWASVGAVVFFLYVIVIPWVFFSMFFFLCDPKSKSKGHVLYGGCNSHVETVSMSSSDIRPSTPNPLTAAAFCTSNIPRFCVETALWTRGQWRSFTTLMCQRMRRRNIWGVLGGGFKHVLLLPLLRGMIQLD